MFDSVVKWAEWTREQNCPVWNTKWKYWIKFCNIFYFCQLFRETCFYGNVWWTTCLNIVRHKTKYNEHSGVSVTRLTSSTDGIYASIVRSNDDIVKYRYSTKYFSVKPFEMKRRENPKICHPQKSLNYCLAWFLDISLQSN